MRGMRHDATGRSETRHRRNPRAKIAGQFVPRLVEMITSPGYRVTSLGARRVMDRLEIEHARHAGEANGRLVVSYDQFEAHGLHRHAIGPAIRELVALGFVQITEQGSAGADFRRASAYRLTYLAAPDSDPTHEWRRILTDEQAKATADAARAEAAAPVRRRSAAA